MSNLDLTEFCATLERIITGPCPAFNPKDLLDAAKMYSRLCDESFISQLENISKPSQLRLSQLGKPAVIQACDLLFQPEQDRNLRMAELLHRGDQWEAWVYSLLSAIDNTHLSLFQEEVEYAGVTGHVDFAVAIDGVRVLVEVKTMSPQYFNKFSRNPDDERGYLTQLSCYSQAIGLPAVWMCLNKGTHEVRVVSHPGIQDERVISCLERAERIIPKLEAVETLEDVFTHFVPPPPVPEVYKKQETGKMLVPPSMKYSNYRHLFYRIVEEDNGYGKSTEYVVGTRDYESTSRLIEEMTA